MQLIISILEPATTHVAYIPDNGNPRCGISLKPLAWTQADVNPQDYPICPECIRTLAQDLTNGHGSRDNA